jgi:hypothetical protein
MQDGQATPSSDRDRRVGDIDSQSGMTRVERRPHHPAGTAPDIEDRPGQDAGESRVDVIRLREEAVDIHSHDAGAPEILQQQRTGPGAQGTLVGVAE